MLQLRETSHPDRKLAFLDRKLAFPDRKLSAAVSLLLVGTVVKMATPRRSSQQQQKQQQSSQLSSPPRGASLPATPPGSPPAPSEDATPLPRGLAGMESVADGEAAPTSPTTTSPALALTSSSSSSVGSSASSPTTTEGSEPSPGSTPDSSGCNPAVNPCSGGAFRELFEACRNGDVSRVKKLVDAVNVNAKDMAGRKSTPLHFAAGKSNKNNTFKRIQSVLGAEGTHKPVANRPGFNSSNNVSKHKK